MNLNHSFYFGFEFSFLTHKDKVKVESIVDNDTAEKIIDLVIEQINTGAYGDGKIFVYDVYDAVRIRTGERGEDAL